MKVLSQFASVGLVLLLCTVFHVSATKRPREGEQDLLADRAVRDAVFNYLEPPAKKLFRLASKDFMESFKLKPTEEFPATCQIRSYIACLNLLPTIKETESTNTLKQAVEKGYLWAAHVLLNFGSLEDDFNINKLIEDYMNTENLDLDTFFVLVQAGNKKYPDRFDVESLIETHLRTPNANQKALATLFHYSNYMQLDFTKTFHLACENGNQYAADFVAKYVSQETLLKGFVFAVKGRHVEIVKYLLSIFENQLPQYLIKNPKDSEWVKQFYNIQHGIVPDLESDPPVSIEEFLAGCESQTYLVCLNLIQRLPSSETLDTLRSALMKGNRWAVSALLNLDMGPDINLPGLIKEYIGTRNADLSTLQALLDVAIRTVPDYPMGELVLPYWQSSPRNQILMPFILSYFNPIHSTIFSFACYYEDGYTIANSMEYVDEQKRRICLKHFIDISQEEFVVYFLSKGVMLPKISRLRSRRWVEQLVKKRELK